MADSINYGEAILAAHEFLLGNYDNTFVIGQGVWSPWYVGSTMKDLEAKFGRERVIETPVSENAATGLAVGASLCGYRPIVVHPRMDFMLFAMDPIVNQAAKWGAMFGGRARPAVTVRGIINRGGEQGAQHSQALHAWFAHIPGLRVVMPATVSDARDLLIAAVLSDDPVLYVDDRWLYDDRSEVEPAAPVDLRTIGPRTLRHGTDVTLVGAGWTTKLALEAGLLLDQHGISAEVIDLRVINPIDHGPVAASVRKTGRLVAIDGGWSNCGLAAEVVAGAAERLAPGDWRARPRRVTLAEAPAPTSRVLEELYYPSAETVVKEVLALTAPLSSRVPNPVS
jgi:pyruvate dehydrogenase E1 component beta subunit